MIKRYSFPKEETAKLLILKLATEEDNYKSVTTTELTHGIVVLGFQDKFELDEKTQKSILIKKATVFDIDVFWKDKPARGWKQYEVNPKTPNHNFA